MEKYLLNKVLELSIMLSKTIQYIEQRLSIFWNTKYFDILLEQKMLLLTKKQQLDKLLVQRHQIQDEELIAKMDEIRKGLNMIMEVINEQLL